MNKKLSVCPITTHINLKDVSKTINAAKIVKKLKLLMIGTNFKRRPKFCVLGLNPHNAEFRGNSEEKNYITSC